MAELDSIWLVSSLHVVAQAAAVVAPLVFISSARLSPDVKGVTTAVIAYLAIMVFSTLLSTFLNYRLTRLRGSLFSQLSEKFCKSVYSNHIRASSTASSHQLIKDIEKIQHATHDMVHQFHSIILPNMIVYLLTFFFSVYVYGVGAAILLSASLAVYFALIKNFIHRQREISRADLENEYAASGFIKDIVECCVSIRAVAADKYFLRALDAKLLKTRSLVDSIADIFIHRNLSIEIGRYLFLVTIVCWIIYVNTDAPPVLFAKIMAFYLVAIRLFDPIDGLVKTTMNFMGAEMLMERAIHIFSSLNEGRLINNYTVSPKECGENMLRVESPAVAFPQSILALSGTVSIRPGDVLQLKGTNGSGKSTLARAIANLDEICAGAIFVNRQVNVTYCHAEAALIEGTVWSNVEFYRPVEKAEAANFFERLAFVQGTDPKDALELPVAEKGSNYSLGQRAKIILVRALLSKPDILIVDELLSALDTDSFNRAMCVMRKCTQALLIVDHGNRVAMHATAVVQLPLGSSEFTQLPSGFSKLS